jgi:hypothetical protein
MRPQYCTLCNKKNGNFKIIASNVYGDKEKKHKFYLCNYCDVRFMYPTLSKKQENKFYKQEFEKFMD